MFSSLPILPLLVFSAEICVVTLCTIRTICIARGRRLIAAALGFFEVSIWLFAIGQIMQHLDNWSCYLAFASGFSLGNFLGVTIERKLALGSLAVHITAPRGARRLVENLKIRCLDLTVLDGRGAAGNVHLLVAVIKRRDLGPLVALIRCHAPDASYFVSDLQTVATASPTEGRRIPGVLPGTLAARAFRAQRAPAGSGHLVATPR